MQLSQNTKCLVAAKHSGLLRMFTREMTSVGADSEYDITHPAFGHLDRQQEKHHQAILWLQTPSTIMC